MDLFLLAGSGALLQSELRPGLQRSGAWNLWLRAGGGGWIHFQTDHQQRQHGAGVHHTDCECTHFPMHMNTYSMHAMSRWFPTFGSDHKINLRAHKNIKEIEKKIKETLFSFSNYSFALLFLFIYLFLFLCIYFLAHHYYIGEFKKSVNDITANINWLTCHWQYCYQPYTHTRTHTHIDKHLVLQFCAAVSR